MIYITSHYPILLDQNHHSNIRSFDVFGSDSLEGFPGSRSDCSGHNGGRGHQQGKYMHTTRKPSIRNLLEVVERDAM